MVKELVKISEKCSSTGESRAGEGFQRKGHYLFAMFEWKTTFAEVHLFSGCRQQVSSLSAHKHTQRSPDTLY